MDKISELFNFENIGGKIKNLAKWSCWTTILLIWLAAPIAFFALLSEEEELCWIPLAAAIVGPLFVWIGSWALYAFGEFVEDVHAIRNNEGPTAEAIAKREAKEKERLEAEEKAKREAEEKAKREAEAKRKAEEKAKREAEEKAKRDAKYSGQAFTCTGCGNIVYYGDDACKTCGKTFDWSAMN